jgi:hypothetical protein
MADDNGGYDASALGGAFGNKLTGYLNTPALPMSAQTRTGIDSNLNAAAGSTQGFDTAFNGAQGIMASGGLTQGMNNNIATAENVGNQYGNIAQSGGFNPYMVSGWSGNLDAQQDYQSMADSFANPMTAPGVQTMRNNIANDVTTNSLAAFNNGGMFGSDDNREQLAEGLGNALAAFDTNRYDQGVANRFQALAGQTGAAGQGFGMGQSAIGNQMNALSGQAGAAGQAFNQRQAGTGNQLSAAAMMPSLYAGKLMPGQTFQDAGRMFEQDADRDYGRFQELLAAFTGSANNPGMGEETPWWQTALGVGGSIAGAFF